MDKVYVLDKAEGKQRKKKINQIKSQDQAAPENYYGRLFVSLLMSVLVSFFF